MKKIITTGFLIMIIFFSGCDIDDTSPAPTPSPTPVDPTPTPETPEYTNIIFEEIDGVIHFETNDPQYLTDNGYTLWIVYDPVDELFSQREIRLSKFSGDSIAGFGMVYCYRDDEIVGRTMLIILINTLKEYLVGESIETTFDVIIPWTISDYLYQGYNQNNRVGLEYNNNEEVFSLFINGHLETTFRDDEQPIHTGGRHGYIVVISPNEDFPEIPVKIQFEQVQE